MITLYHGSNVAIDETDLTKGIKDKDFGQGFYLTDILSQAESMAKRRARIVGSGCPTISTFSFDDSLLLSDELNIKIFPDQPNVEWARIESSVLLWYREGYSKIEEDMTKETKFLLDTLTKNLVLKVMEEFGYSITEAMDVVYNSQLYEKVLDLETGLYYQSAGYNYDLLRNELLTRKVA
jgi:hypothetical protein